MCNSRIELESRIPRESPFCCAPQKQQLDGEELELSKTNNILEQLHSLFLAIAIDCYLFQGNQAAICTSWSLLLVHMLVWETGIGLAQLLTFQTAFLKNKLL